jgi:hypothetical protein
VLEQPGAELGPLAGGLHEAGGEQRRAMLIRQVALRAEIERAEHLALQIAGGRLLFILQLPGEQLVIHLQRRRAVDEGLAGCADERSFQRRGGAVFEVVLMQPNNGSMPLLKSRSCRTVILLRRLSLCHSVIVSLTRSSSLNRPSFSAAKAVRHQKAFVPL